MKRTNPNGRLVAGALIAALTLGACSAATEPGGAPAGAATPRPTPTAVPGDTGPGDGIGSAPGSGGGSGSGTGDDPDGGLFPIRGGPNDNPMLGKATYLTAVNGLVNRRVANVQFVRAVIRADGSVTADLRWWSGVAPCTLLDHVEIQKDDAAKSIRLKVIEGSGAGDVVCIEIAQLSATLVDLGRLAPGPWTITAAGDAPPIPLNVP